ncbi:MAG TPA: sigma-70 family RNA polymerase sigma factor [Pyrinomonadaceae bacterium]|jgi:RNA polymerase sigma factor (TIGR02999 family)
MADAHEITDLLRAWGDGDAAALDRAMPLVDRELRKLAHAYLARERGGHTLQTTALINEALMRLLNSDKIAWQSRSHFYSIVARRMRQVLIEHARSQLALKRGHRAEHVPISDAGQLSAEQSQELVLLDAALNKLAEIDRRKSQVIEYRYFGGFTIEEVAEMLQISPSTVQNEWRLARSWLRCEILSETSAA